MSCHLWLSIYTLELSPKEPESAFCMWRRGGCLLCGCSPGYQEGIWPFHWKNSQIPTSVYSLPPWAVQLPREVPLNPRPDGCKPGFQ